MYHNLTLWKFQIVNTWLNLIFTSSLNNSAYLAKLLNSSNSFKVATLNSDGDTLYFHILQVALWYCGNFQGLCINNEPIYMRYTVPVCWHTRGDRPGLVPHVLTSGATRLGLYSGADDPSNRSPLSRTE